MNKKTPDRKLKTKLRKRKLVPFGVPQRFHGLPDVLNQPMSILSEDVYRVLVSTEPELENSYDQARDLDLLFQVRERWSALADHYGIGRFWETSGGSNENDGLVQLLHSLARDVFLGFNFEGSVTVPKAGATRGDGQLRDDLYVLDSDINDIFPTAKSERNAIRILCIRNPRWKGQDPANLRGQLQRFRERMTNIEKEMRAYPMRGKLLDELDKVLKKNAGTRNSD